jgi:hypothetical protein
MHCHAAIASLQGTSCGKDRGANAREYPQENEEIFRMYGCHWQPGPQKNNTFTRRRLAAPSRRDVHAAAFSETQSFRFSNLSAKRVTHNSPLNSADVLPPFDFTKHLLSHATS